MKYFSRIELDESHAQAGEAVAKVFGDVYTDHQLLWHFFPAPVGHARDFLFRRLQSRTRGPHPLYYCVSDRPAMAPHPAWRVASREYSPRVSKGDRFLFDLRVNPTQTHKREGRSYRDDVVMHAKKRWLAERDLRRWTDLPAKDRPSLYELADAAVRAWLGAEGNDGFAARHGFAVTEDLRVDAYRQHRIHRHGAVKPISFSTIDLAGTLVVTDAAAFARALVAGVGRAKAFGCGLLLVRRA